MRITVAIEFSEIAPTELQRLYLMGTQDSELLKTSITSQLEGSLLDLHVAEVRIEEE